MIKNLESKIKTSLIIAVVSIIGGIGVSVFSMVYAFNKVSEERKNIYVLDNGVPILVNRTNQEVNRLVEYKSHINLFHTLFFTLPPDDAFIKNNIEKK